MSPLFLFLLHQLFVQPHNIVDI
ncbi:MAG: hypothetical protein RJA90_1903, partial [Bacteroidota bacterium]